jgi:hypothetical protein
VGEKTTSAKPRPKRLPRPDAPRAIARSFGWIDAEFLRQGWFVHLTPEEVTLYLFLCLVADRDGVSFYRVDTIERKLGMRDDVILKGREHLVTMGLTAFEPYGVGQRDGFWQVLRVPPCPKF